MSIWLDEESFVDNLVVMDKNLHDNLVKTPKSPYKSGLPVNKIRDQKYSDREQDLVTKKYQSIVGSLNWLSVSTQPDISTITNMLAQYSSRTTYGHVAHARHTVRYLKGSKSLGISFLSQQR